MILLGIVLKEMIRMYKEYKFSNIEEGKDEYGVSDAIRLSSLALEFPQQIFFVKSSQPGTYYYPILQEMREQSLTFSVQGKLPSHEFAPSQTSMDNGDFDEGSLADKENPDEELFPLLKGSDIDEALKIKDSLRKKTLEEKKSYLFNVLKIKKHHGPSLAKQSYCPVYECHDKFNNTKNLRQHIIKKHPKLSEFEVELTETGELRWPEYLIDYSILLSKLYPAFVKRVISQSKKIDKGR